MDMGSEVSAMTLTTCSAGAASESGITYINSSVAVRSSIYMRAFNSKCHFIAFHNSNGGCDINFNPISFANSSYFFRKVC